MARPTTIASASYKGGPGKSFIATTLAGLLAQKGHSVVVVDLDGQCAQTQNLNVGVTPGHTMEEWLGGAEDPSPLIHVTKVPGISLLPAHPDIVNVPHNQATYTQVPRLVRALGGVVDYVVLDTAPASHPLAMSALLASDFFVTPLRPAVKEVVNSLRLFDRDVEQAKMFNPGLGDLGIIINQYDPGAPTQARIVEELRARVGGRMNPCPIRVSRDVVNAERAGLPATIHKPNSALARMVRATFKPVLWGLQA